MGDMQKLEAVLEEDWLKVCKFNREISNEFLKQAHFSLQTMKQYRSGVRQFFKWVLDELENIEFTKIKARHAQRYVNYLSELGLSGKAIQFKIACVSSLANYVEKFYEDEYPTFKNIFSKVSKPSKVAIRKKEPLTKEEYDLLLETLEENEQWQILAYIKFSYASGCRRNEVRQLKKEVVNYPKIKDKYYLTHEIRGKGRGKIGKVSQYKFDEDAMNAIKKWIEIRGEDNCPYVFARKEGNVVKQVAENTFNYWCSDILSKIINKRVHPHNFRTSRASHIVLYEGKDIKVAQALLNHESSSTTEGYVIRDKTEDADEAF